MTLTERMARAHFREMYPDWPQEHWDGLSVNEREPYIRIARRAERVMAVALRDGDDLGNGLTARKA